MSDFATLQEMHAAKEAATASTPSAVLDAYLPDPASAAGVGLVPVTAGHLLLLEKIRSPLVMPAERRTQFAIWQALYILSRPARDGRAALAAGKLEDATLALADSMPASIMEPIVDQLQAHMAAAFENALPMQMPGGTTGTQKKTADSGG